MIEYVKDVKFNSVGLYVDIVKCQTPTRTLKH